MPSAPRRVWFQAAPAPTTAQSGHDGTSELYVVDHGLSWGVLQTPVLSPQRERPEEWAVMPHALLYSMTYRLHQIGADLSEDLRRSVLERSEPIDVDASSGRLSFIEVEGELLLAYRMTFSGERALASLFDDSWLVVLCPIEKSAALVLANSLGIAGD